MVNVAILYTETPTHPIVLTEEHVNFLRSRLDGELRWYRSEAELLADGFDAEVLLCWGRETPDAAARHYPNLKWVQSLSAGVEGLAKMEAAQSGKLTLSKMKAVHGPVMAQTTLCYILSFLRDFPVLLAQQRRAEWHKPALSALRECCDTTVGIFGMGDIGGEVAKLCKKMDMTVLGCRRHAAPAENVDEMFPVDRLNEMLARCDFVVNLLPDTPTTAKIVNRDFFAAMQPSAVFINIGRGATVDNDALIEALRSGVIAGAALDVASPEPLGPDSPLWTMENVILTPHCSADSKNYFDRAVVTLAENLEAYQQGRGVPTAVNY